MITMRENGHLNQEKLNNESEVMQNRKQVQSELLEVKQEKNFMTIKEVVALLNDNETIESVAQKLQMRASVLEAKLANAAVVVNNDGEWRYGGDNEIDSLSRNIFSKIYVKSYDKKIVESSNGVTSNADEVVTNLDYELYKNSLNIKYPIDKKSVLFEEGLYEELKELSKQKSIKMSNLINALIFKGLEYYHLK